MFDPDLKLELLKFLLLFHQTMSLAVHHVSNMNASVGYGQMLITLFC